MNLTEKTTPPSTEIDNLISRAFDVCRSNPQNGIELADEALLYVAPDSWQKAQATVCKGACQVWIGDYENALKNLLEHINEFEKFKDNKFEAHALYHVFCAFYFLADYDNALKYAFEMLARAEKKQDILAQANAFNGIGTIYHSSNENEKAIEVLSKGLAIAQKLGDKHLLARILDE